MPRRSWAVSAGNDSVVLTGSDASLVVGSAGMNFITGNAGADKFINQNSYGNISAVTNFNTGKGDKIALDTTGSSIMSGNTYNLGGAAITLGTDLADVADAVAIRNDAVQWWQGRLRIPTGYRRAVLQQQWFLCRWRNADWHSHHRWLDTLDFQCQQLHAGLAACGLTEMDRLTRNTSAIRA